jgi:hypothetical protein
MQIPEKTVSDTILDRFLESIKNDRLLTDIADNLVTTMREKHGKNKIKELLRKPE